MSGQQMNTPRYRRPEAEGGTTVNYTDYQRAWLRKAQVQRGTSVEATLDWIMEQAIPDLRPNATEVEAR